MAPLDKCETAMWSQIIHKLDPTGEFQHAHQYLDGQTAITTRLTWENAQGVEKTAVVRQLRAHKDATQEIRILQTVQNFGIKAPPPYFLDETGTILSTPYLVMSHIAGQEPPFAKSTPTAASLKSS